MAGRVHFRPYQPKDETACLAIFDSNCPKFLAPSERDEFRDYIRVNAKRANYLVGELDQKIVACGGIFIDPESQAGYFAWGLVLNACHGQGIGHALTRQRMQLAATKGAKTLHLDTSQHTQGFYEKLGFIATKVTKNGCGEGLDRVDMVKTL